MRNGIIRSPFFYVGDKYKLMPQLKKLMPSKINSYIEPFVGGGSSFINSSGKRYVVNDIDSNVINLHIEISKYANKPDVLFDKLFALIDRYGLSCSYRNITVPDELKKQYVKTYYSHYNKEAYNQMRDDYNKGQSDMLVLYLLLIYGFNHMIRYNSSGYFNLPVGNVDFNKNVYTALNEYLSFINTHQVEFSNKSYQEFLEDINFSKDSYVFLDPPYLISSSEYNKHWNETEEIKLCSFLDKMNSDGIRFGITNLIEHKGKVNSTFLEWSKKYHAFNINSNYISFNDNTIKENSKEVFVTNYDNN